MSDYARNLDTYNDGAAEEPCEFCGTYVCVCPFEEAVLVCEQQALMWHVTDPNNEAGLSAESGAGWCAHLIRLKAEAAKETGEHG